MDNDHDILELAAKAANLGFVPQFTNEWFVVPGVKYGYWNPLISDTHALRLMVKLCMLINVGETEVMVAGGPDIMVSLTYGMNNKEQTVRRAIVLAVAEIGKRTP